MLYVAKTLHHFHVECVRIKLSRDCIGYGDMDAVVDEGVMKAGGGRKEIVGNHYILSTSWSDRSMDNLLSTFDDGYSPKPIRSMRKMERCDIGNIIGKM